MISDTFFIIKNSSIHVFSWLLPTATRSESSVASLRLDSATEPRSDNFRLEDYRLQIIRKAGRTAKLP